MCRRAVDRALGEVAGVADYERKSTTVRVGDGCEAVPVAQWPLSYNTISFIAWSSFLETHLDEQLYRLPG